MAFTRGQKPTEALGIGMEGLLKELGGLVLHPDDFIGQIKDVHCIPTKYEFPECLQEYTGKWYEAGIVILVVDEKYRILKTRYPYDDKYEVGYYKDLPKVIREIHEKVKDWSSWDIETDGFFPIAKAVAAKTLGQDLVSVRPMASPKGILPVFNTKYDWKEQNKKANAIQKGKKRKRGS